MFYKQNNIDLQCNNIYEKIKKSNRQQTMIILKNIYFIKRIIIIIVIVDWGSLGKKT